MTSSSSLSHVGLTTGEELSEGHSLGSPNASYLADNNFGLGTTDQADAGPVRSLEPTCDGESTASFSAIDHEEVEARGIFATSSYCEPSVRLTVPDELASSAGSNFHAAVFEAWQSLEPANETVDLLGRMFGFFDDPLGSMFKMKYNRPVPVPQPADSLPSAPDQLEMARKKLRCEASSFMGILHDRGRKGICPPGGAVAMEGAHPALGSQCERCN